MPMALNALEDLKNKNVGNAGVMLSATCVVFLFSVRVLGSYIMK